MISKHLTILPAAAALLLSTACSNDDMDGILADGPVAAQVTADISDGQTATRTSTDNDGASFTEGDEIHVVASGTTYDYIKQSDGTWSSDNPYYFQDGNTVYFQGWYADPTLTATDNSISINTTSQTTTDGWNEWDILATPVVTTDVTSPTVNFTSSNNAAFQHVMSQATITFKAGDGIDDLTKLTEYTLGTLTTDATFNTLTCALTKGNTTGSITQTVADASGTEVSSTIILVPQDVTSGLTLEVTYNGQTYTTDLALPDNATALAEGTHYAFNVTIANTGLTVNSAEIKSWSMLTAETSSASLKGYYVTTDADGTETYVVFGEAGLLAWADYVTAGNYSTNCTLIKDITLSTVAEGKSNWTAVGSSSYRYTGTFDGNGYTIENLTISASSNYKGLIGYLGSGGEVKNLTMADVNITSSRSYVGAVVGYNNYGTVTNCFTLGSVSGNWYTGGVVGDNYYGTVTNCNSSCTVKGSDYTGGEVGSNNFGYVTACYFVGVVSSTGDCTGGVVGSNDFGNVTACYATGAVSGAYNTGGVAGINVEGTLTACYWYNTTTTYGIGEGDDGETTYVDGTEVTWTNAAETMNTALIGSGWQYTGDGTTTPPLTLVTE